MKIPATEKPGQVKRFRNKYLALITLSLVLFTVSAKAQHPLDTAHARQPIPANPGMEWIGGSFIKSFTLPSDTFRLSIRDVGSLAYKNGQVYLYRVNTTCSCLRWDTLSGGIGGVAGSDSASIGTNGVTLTRVGNVITYKLDTAWVTANYLLNHPFIIKADTAGGIRINGDTISCPGCNVGGASTAYIDSILAAGTTLSVTTTGSSGPATLTGGTLNIPQYSGGGGTPANPSASTGLTAVNGSASTYMRSDAAPPVSQAITPTWTGLHTFSAGLKSAADVLPTTNYGPNVGSGSFIWSNIYSGQSHADLYSPNGGDFKAGGTTNQPALTIFSSGGNVAIHTLGATPTDFGNKLQVNGDALITDSLRVGTIRNSAPGDSVMYVHNNVPRKGLAPSGTVALGNVPVFNIPVPADSIKIQKNLGFVDARTFGYNPDGKFLRDGAMTSTSATFTSATAGFTSGDVGKVIHVKGVGASSKDSTGTITGFTNSTTVTLSFVASTSKTGAQFIYGTDMTTPVQNTLNAVFDNGGGTGFLSAGIAIINGPRIRSLSSKDPNSQLYIKFQDPQAGPTNTKQPIVVKLLGETDVSFSEGALAQQNPPLNGTILYSTLTYAPIAPSDTFPSVLGTVGFTTGFGDFNAVDLYVEKITFRVTGNKNSGGPAMSAVNGSKFVGSSFVNSRADIDIPVTLSSLPTRNVFGFKTTQLNGATNVILNNVYADGFKWAFVIGEHTTGNNIQGCGNETLIGTTQMNHAAHLSRVCSQWNKSAIGNFTPEQGVALLSIDQLDMELRTDGSWYDNVNTINDPNSYIDGRIYYYSVNTLGATFTVNGGTQLSITALRDGNVSKRQRLGASGNAITTGAPSLTGEAVLELNTTNPSTGLDNLPVLRFVTDQADTTTAGLGVVGVEEWINPHAGASDNSVAQKLVVLDPGAHSFKKGKVSEYVSNGTTVVEAITFTSDYVKFPGYASTNQSADTTNYKVAVFGSDGKIKKMYWPSLGGGGGGGTPGGSSGDIQWNSSGSFAGGGATYDGTTGAITNNKSVTGVLRTTQKNTNNCSTCLSVFETKDDAGSTMWAGSLNTSYSTDGALQGNRSIIYTDRPLTIASEMDILFSAQKGRVQTARMTTGGYFGIGTNFTPTVKLHVRDTLSTGPTTEIIEATNAAQYADMQWYNQSGLAAQMLASGSSFSSGIVNSNSASFMGYQSGGTNIVAGHASGVIRFAAGGFGTINEKMRMDATGTILTVGSDGTGDLYYRNSSGYLTRLGIGTAGQLLHPNGSGGYVWKDTVLVGSGSYTPTLTNTTNITSSTLEYGMYTQTGNIVTVRVSGTLSATSAALSKLTISLPVSTATTTQNGAGQGVVETTASLLAQPGPGFVFVDSGTTASFICFPTATGSRQFSVTFMYKTN